MSQEKPKAAMKLKEYYQNNKEELLVKRKKYYQDNREEILKRRKEYNLKNREKINKRQRIYSVKYRKDNREILLVKQNIYYNTETFDTDGCYDNSTNYRFTPTTAGKY